MRSTMRSVCLLLSTLIVVSSVQAAQYSAMLRQDEYANSGHAAFTLIFTNAPTPTAGGTIKVRASGDLDTASEYLDVIVEGISLGYLFNSNPSDDRFDNAASGDLGLNYSPVSSTALLTLAEFQTLTADGEIRVTIDPSQSVNDSGAGEFVEVTITYEAGSTGACCIASTETCQDLSAADCANLSGTYSGDGTSCGTFVCFPHGACCLGNGTCQGDALSPAQCAALAGTFQGNGSTCAASDCRIKGACCSGGTCSIQAETDCVTAGGSYKGNNTACSGDSDGDGFANECDACPNTIAGAPVDSVGCPAVVPADFDRDGDVDSADLGLFAACDSGPAVPFATNCGGKDLDGDNDVDQDDFSVFQLCYKGANVLGNPACAD